MPLNRQQRAQVYGSPSYSESPTITANKVYQIDFSDTHRMSKYKPFNYFSIINNSSSDLLIKVRDSEYYVEANTIFEVSPDEILFNELRIEEKSGTNITAGELRVSIAKRGATSDSLAKEQKLRQFTPQGSLKQIPFIGRFV